MNIEETEMMTLFSGIRQAGKNLVCSSLCQLVDQEGLFKLGVLTREKYVGTVSLSHSLASRLFRLST